MASRIILEVEKAHALSPLQALKAQTGCCLLHCARAFLDAFPKRATKDLRSLEKGKRGKSRVVLGVKQRLSTK